MWQRSAFLVVLLVAVGCGSDSEDGGANVFRAGDAAEEAGVDGGPADAGDVADTGETGPGERRVVFVGKDPGEASYELAVGGTLEGESLESSDETQPSSAEGRIDAIGERDVYTIHGEIETLTAEGNIEAQVDGEPRVNGPEVREKEAPDDRGPRLGMTIHSSVELLETNGRVSERVIAKFAARAFEKAGFGYRIVHNLYPERPPDEKANCSAGDAPQWWRDRVTGEWDDQVVFDQQREAEVQPSGRPFVMLEDVNILMLSVNGGGCGAIGGLYGTTPALNIDEMREWKAVGSGDWHRNIHGTLHEIGHQLGARHDHDDGREGQQHPGAGWNEEGPEGKTWWHRTPTTAGNGAPNRCGTYIRKRQSQPNVRRHQTFADCAVRLFERKPVPDEFAGQLIAD